MIYSNFLSKNFKAKLFIIPLSLLFCIPLFFSSCEKNMEVETIVEHQDVKELEGSLRAVTDTGPNPNNPNNPSALCIGCGCESDYKDCKNAVCQGSGAQHVCCVGTTIDLSCCKGYRNDCHKCDDGFICIRFGMIMDTMDLTPTQQSIVNGGRDIFSIDELTLTQLALLDPYESTIVKWQNGNTLSDADFELLDTPADEL